MGFMVINRTAVMMVTQLMELAARTAPKAKGVDTIFTRILTGKKIQAFQVTRQIPEKTQD